jgi:uncharacterized protein (DUF2267 family)
MDETSVLSHLAERTGITERVALHRALVVTLYAIRDMVERPLVLRLADVLPTTMAIALRGPSQDAPVDLDDLFERVQCATGLRADAAREITQSCLSMLGAFLDENLRDRLTAVLPPQFSVHVDRRDPPRLAGDTGLSITHGHSVAASDDPHADTRLSSARDVRTEKLSEARPGAGARSLAEGRPGAGPRSIADARPQK